MNDRIKDPLLSQGSRTGLPEGQIRATLIMKEENLTLLKSMALWEKKTVQEILDEAILSLFKQKDLRELAFLENFFNKMTEEGDKDFDRARAMKVLNQLREQGFFFNLEDIHHSNPLQSSF